MSAGYKSVQNTQAALIKRLHRLSKTGIFNSSGALNQSDRAVLQFLYLRTAVNTVQDIERGHVLRWEFDPARISEATGVGVREVRMALRRLDEAGLVKASWRRTPSGREKAADIVIDLDDLDVRPVGKAGGTVDVENLQIELLEWVITLTGRGEFDRHQAARAVFAYYCFNIAANANKRLGRESGEVMEMCVLPAVVARNTGLDEQTVRRANDWLHEQGFVWSEDLIGDRYRYVVSITIMTIDENSEDKRKLTAGTVTRRLSPQTDLTQDGTDLTQDIDSQLRQPATTASAPGGASSQDNDFGAGDMDGHSAQPPSAQPAAKRRVINSEPVSQPADARPVEEIWAELLRSVAEEEIRRTCTSVPVGQMMKTIGRGGTFRQQLATCREYMADLNVDSNVLDELQRRAG